MTSKEILVAARYETKSNKFAARCECCGKAMAAGAERVARAPGGQNWVPVCETVACATALLAADRVVQGEAGGNPVDKAGF